MVSIFGRITLAAVALSTVFLSSVNGANSAVPSINTAPLNTVAPENATKPSSNKVSIIRTRARIARAAICTEDVSQISFQEYSVDWSAWMTAVASRWYVSFNNAYASGKFRPDGQAYLQFTCNNDGSIADATVLTSSGDVACDQSQIQALKDSVPLPKFPAGCKKKSITFLYVWDYGVSKNLAKHTNKPASHRAQLADPRISISGKAM